MEYAKNKIAEKLSASSSSKAKALGKAVGSSPFTVPYVPFNGEMEVRKDGHPVTKGLSNSFEVTVPSAYQRDRFKAYTLFGWQFGIPAPQAMKMAKEKAKEVRDEADPHLEEVSKFQEEVLGKQIGKRHYKKALKGEITSKLSRFNLTGNKIKFNLGEGERKINIGDKASRIRTKLNNYLPVKSVITSENYLAGVLANNEWYRPDGFRSVYISFEPEASTDKEGWKILKNSVDWTSNWEFRTDDLAKNIVGISKETYNEYKKGSEKVFSNNVDFAIAKSVYDKVPAEINDESLYIGSRARKLTNARFNSNQMNFKGNKYKSKWKKKDYGLIQIKGEMILVIGTHRFGTKAALSYYKNKRIKQTTVVKWEDQNNDNKVQLSETTKVTKS